MWFAGVTETDRRANRSRLCLTCCTRDEVHRRGDISKSRSRVLASEGEVELG